MIKRYYILWWLRDEELRNERNKLWEMKLIGISAMDLPNHGGACPIDTPRIRIGLQFQTVCF